MLLASLLAMPMLGVPSAQTPSDLQPPAVAREFRAAWVATVDNIDWPSKRGLPVADQKRELLAIFDQAQRIGLNAIVLQVRPACDALYASKLEPWSEYLTGRQGTPPAPYYDPLAFAVEEAHRRGLELHAWFNPYRAKHPSAKAPLAASHIANRNAGVVRTYGKQLWLDPGESFVQKRSLDVMLDVVRRYDIDGVHIDDYFYPYPEKGVPFPDDATYAAYRQRGGTLALPDWRRKNVDDFIERLYGGIKRTKRWVKFGISPFGIYRPGQPEGIAAGIDQYAELYADARKWLVEGWCDYYTPQLYWPIAQKPQSYPVLLNWWVAQNSKGRHMWPGNYTSRILPAVSNMPPQEILDQIRVTRETPGATGNVHFSMKVLSQNTGGIADRLRREAYAEPALPPASPWLDDRAPAKPKIGARATGALWSATWSTTGEQPFWWVLWQKRGGTWRTRVLPGQVRSETLTSIDADGRLEAILVAAVDRSGNQSPIASVALP